VAHNLVKNLVKFCSRPWPWRNRFRAINSRNQFPAFEESSQLAALPSYEVLSTTHPPPTDFESHSFYFAPRCSKDDMELKREGRSTDPNCASGSGGDVQCTSKWGGIHRRQFATRIREWNVLIDNLQRKLNLT
jgi:hypothetical protein